MGECVVASCRVPSSALASSAALPMPPGVHRVGGLPAMLVVASYEASPVGPYRELAIAVPARLGVRPGLCVVLSVVDCVDARAAYREQWSLPTELGRLRWSTSLSRVVCSWLDGGVEVLADVAGRGRGLAGARLPVALPARSLQRRADGPVVLPRWLWGWARAARVSVSVAGDAETRAGSGFARAAPSVAWLAGPHAGFVVSSMRVAASPARHPTGLLSSLRAPTVAGAGGGTAEPALSESRATVKWPAQPCWSFGGIGRLVGLPGA